MKDGFIKVAVATPEISVADTVKNTESIKKIILEAHKNRVQLLCLPELCITGSTCGDLFSSSMLQTATLKSVLEITKYTKGKTPVTVVGFHLGISGKIYSVAGVIYNGELLGIVPKRTAARPFANGGFLKTTTLLDGKEIPVNSNLLFRHKEISSFAFGIEISEDLFSFLPPSNPLSLCGANIILNPASFKETVTSEKNITSQITALSNRLSVGYLLACADKNESTSDSVCSGYSLICEKGEILSKNKPFGDGSLIISEIDTQLLSMKKNDISEENNRFCFEEIIFSSKIYDTDLTRKIAKNPFVPEEKNELFEKCEKILNIQSFALKKRLEHTNAKTAVIGISGGLDSTLALLVCARAMHLCGRPATDISAITMPCFGTTKRTRSNSEKLCLALGVNFKEINITKAVKQHFIDIQQNPDNLDITFENSQARERTQVLMDIANKEGGLVIGTGDLSELALGWATYNGDHMSMYGVNSGIPKTLIRKIVEFEAENYGGEIKDILFDILDTPVSPELLPADKSGNIAQKTEDLVGPYELHDFFIYHTINNGFSPQKIFRLSVYIFSEYDKSTILHWLTVFTRRFFNQQFKRSCLPDGPAVGSVSLSPRGAFSMPTDASSNIWIKELEELKEN